MIRGLLFHSNVLNLLQVYLSAQRARGGKQKEDKKNREERSFLSYLSSLLFAFFFFSFFLLSFFGPKDRLLRSSLTYQIMPYICTNRFFFNLAWLNDEALSDYTTQRKPLCRRKRKKKIDSA